MAQLDPAVQTQLVASSPLAADYSAVVDRDSAYEMLLAKVAPEPAAEPEPETPQRPRQRQEPESEGAVAAVLGSSVFRSFARSAASAAGREISRSLFGTAPRRRRRRR
jgi:cell pole-organizing protein PopZ